VSLNVLLRIWRKELGLKGKEWCCRNCRHGLLKTKDVCGYVESLVPFPRVCIYVQYRIHAWLAREIRLIKGLADDRN